MSSDEAARAGIIGAMSRPERNEQGPPIAIRAMLSGDIGASVRIKAAAFDVDPGEQADTSERWTRQARHLLMSDPGGSFVAERDGQTIGVVQALRRERLWCLSLLAVDPRAQSAGAGRRLLERALARAAPGDAGLIVGSNDPRALRLYGLAGFSLKPTLQSEGALDRRALPRPSGAIREAGAADLDELAAISRELRGAPHTRELQYAMDEGARLLRLADAGYAAVVPGHGLWMLAARDEATASALLWHALELAGETERPAIRWITAEQRWAVEVVLKAGLSLSSYGALCVRGEPGPLQPYLPSGPFA